MARAKRKVLIAADITVAVMAMGLPGCGSQHTPCDPEAGAPQPGEMCACPDGGPCEVDIAPADAGPRDAGDE